METEASTSMDPFYFVIPMHVSWCYVIYNIRLRQLSFVWVIIGVFGDYNLRDIFAIVLLKDQLLNLCSSSASERQRTNHINLPFLVCLFNISVLCALIDRVFWICVTRCYLTAICSSELEKLVIWLLSDWGIYDLDMPWIHPLELGQLANLFLNGINKTSFNGTVDITCVKAGKEKKDFAWSVIFHFE